MTSLALSFLANVVSLPDPDTIRRTAEEVVQRPEFQLQPSRSQFALLELIIRVLQSIFRFFGSLWEISAPLAIVVMIVLVVVLVLLVAHIVYTFKQALTARIRSPDGSALEQQVLDPRRYEIQADEAVARHDYIGAVRLLFRAALLRLEQSEKRAPRPGVTNREHLRRYRQSAIFEALRQFVDVIDAKWYGYGACDIEDYQQCRAAHAMIVAQAKV